LMTMSLKETFVSGMLLIIALDFMASSINFADSFKWGAENRDS
jgi:hypothetical protein